MAKPLRSAAIVGNRYSVFVVILLVSIFLHGCEKEPKKIRPMDYSSIRATINGKECHMLSGYNCEPVNRTLVGHEYNGNVRLVFNSLYMAEHPTPVDSAFYINISLYFKKDNIVLDEKLAFNRSIDSTEFWDTQFETGVVKSLVIFAKIQTIAMGADIDRVKTTYFNSTSGWVSITGADVQPHPLYGGDRWIWKCNEVYYEFEAVSNNGETIHVTDGYCRL